MRKHAWLVHYDHIVEVGADMTKAKKKKAIIATREEKMIEAENSFHYSLDSGDKSKITLIKYLGAFIDHKIENKKDETLS